MARDTTTVLYAEIEMLRAEMRSLRSQLDHAEARADEVERLATEAFEDLIDQLQGWHDGAELAESIRDDFALTLHPELLEAA